MKAGIFQCDCGGLDADARIETLARYLEGQAVDLVLCPELFMSGYAIGDAVKQYAEPVNGAFASKVSALARQYNTAIVYGYPEQFENQLYNSAACIAADGKLLANHRKLLLPPGFEEQLFVQGEQQTLFTVAGMRCAILICYDSEYPENVRAVAQAGAQVILVPTALVDQWPVVARQVIPARAFENGVWVLYANHAGYEGGSHYLGESCIVTPEGKDAARAAAREVFFTAVIQAEAVTNAQTRLPYLAGAAQLKRKFLSSSP